MIQGKLNAVFFERHGVIAFCILDDLDAGDAQLVAAGDARGAAVGAHHAGDDHRRFLGEMHYPLE